MTVTIVQYLRSDQEWIAMAQIRDNQGWIVAYVCPRGAIAPTDLDGPPAAETVCLVYPYDHNAPSGGYAELDRAGRTIRRHGRCTERMDLSYFAWLLDRAVEAGLDLSMTAEEPG